MDSADKEPELTGKTTRQGQGLQYNKYYINIFIYMLEQLSNIMFLRGSPRHRPPKYTYIFSEFLQWGGSGNGGEVGIVERYEWRTNVESLTFD